MFDRPVQMPFDAVSVARWENGFYLVLSHQGKDMIEIKLPELAVGGRFTQGGLAGTLQGRLSTT